MRRTRKTKKSSKSSKRSKKGTVSFYKKTMKQIVNFTKVCINKSTKAISDIIKKANIRGSK